MTGVVYTHTYGPPEYRRKEIFRYAGAPSATPELEELMEGCLKEVQGKLAYRVCWREFPVSHHGDHLDLTFTRTASAALRRNLTGCDSIVLFAATIGIGLDRLIARYNNLSPAKALMFQAIGAERIEALCDTFNGEIARQRRAEGRQPRPRFSPGYGDLPLTVQKDIFQVLDCPRQIGLTLNESLLMSPSKSVTAIIGIAPGGEGGQGPTGRAACGGQSCAYRRQV